MKRSHSALTTASRRSVKKNVSASSCWLIGVAILLFSTSARATVATVMQFEGVAAPGSYVVPVTPYTEGGFTLTANSQDTGIFSPPFQEPPSAGFTSDYFSFNAPTTVVTLTAASLAPFDLISLDLGIGAAAELTSIIDVTLTGALAGGGTVSTTISSVSAVTTQPLSWTGLSSVTISATEDPGLDNITLTPVPEPTTFTLLGLASLVLVMGRRRR